MKAKNIFLLLMIYFLNSCSSIGHLEFMKVPINGQLDIFVNELIKLGFTGPHPVRENKVKLKGFFLEKNCEIYVYATMKNKTAYRVRVNLPGEIPDSLKSNFEKIQRIYASEYGTAKTRYKQYNNPERFMFNEPGLTRQLRKGDFSRYVTASGDITVEVQDGYISITYTDYLNSEIRKRELEEEYNKEINSE
jgi:hypothetical protein